MSNAPAPAGQKPRTIDDVMQTVAMTAEEARLLEGGAAPQSPLEAKADNPPDPDSVPEWVQFPPGMKIPPGKQVGFMLFRAAWTDRPDKGDRHVVIWPLSDAEERMAYKRARDDSMRMAGELSKQMIRAIDGHKVDWTGGMGPGNPDRFWDEIGSKCRKLLQNCYVKTHTLGEDEQADFFHNCVGFRSSQPA